MTERISCPICHKRLSDSRGLNKHLGAAHGSAAAARHGIRREPDTDTHADRHIDRLARAIEQVGERQP